MGRKKAGLHVKIQNREKDLPHIMEMLIRERKPLSFQAMLQSFKEFGGGGFEALNVSVDDIEAFGKLVMNSAYSSQKVAINQRLISVYDEAWSFDTIEEQAKIYSKELETLVFAYAIYEEDILYFSVYENGETLTQGHLGNLSGYDLEPICPDVKQIKTIFRQPGSLPNLEKLTVMDSITLWEQAFWKDLGILLWVDEQLPVLAMEDALKSQEPCQVYMEMKF